MKKNHWLLIAVVLVLLGLGAFAIVMYQTPSTVKLDISGTPGLNVTGTYTADDKSVDIAAAIPTAVNTKGRTISYVIKNPDESGSMTVKVYVNGDYRGSITAEGAYGIVRGTIENGKVSQRAEQRQAD